jgi:hypothetical protein
MIVRGSPTLNCTGRLPRRQIRRADSPAQRGHCQGGGAEGGAPVVAIDLAAAIAGVAPSRDTVTRGEAARVRRATPFDPSLAAHGIREDEARLSPVDRGWCLGRSHTRLEQSAPNHAFSFVSSICGTRGADARVAHIRARLK